jgi:MoxR-like ATPase
LIMSTPEENQEIEVVREFAGGAIRIEREFNEKLDQTVEYVNILGVRVRRRDPDFDRFSGQEENEKAPVYQGSVEQFSDLSFGPAEIEFLQSVMMRFAIGHHSLFLGPPGFGKSRMLEFFAFLVNIPYFRVQCERGMNVEQRFLWTYVRDNGTWKGRLGPLPLSMMKGGLLHVDEINNLEPDERQLILEPTERPNNPALFNEPSTLHMGDFPGQEVEIKANPGWFLAATGNYREGQGIGEIKDLSEREERRVRPHMLGALPHGTHARRMAGRYAKGSKEREKLNLQPRSYCPKELLEIPDDVVEAVSQFFQEVHEVISSEVLKDLRQDPKIFLAETYDRAFDHFMIFQIQKAAEEGRDPVDIKIEELLESAVSALEFYYVNAFREETRMKMPAHPDNILSAELKAAKVNDRVPVRMYLKWRIRNLLEQQIWKLKRGTQEVQIGIKDRLSVALTGKTIHEREEERKRTPQKMKVGIAGILSAMQGKLTKGPEAAGEHVISVEQRDKLLKTLKARFEANMNRHPGIHWIDVVGLFAHQVGHEQLWSLNEMERTGGEPDVVGRDGRQSNEYIFMDCSAESPFGRMDCVYDREAEEEVKKKGGTCNGNAVDLAKEMGIELLTEEQYRELQKLGEFDKNSLSWIKTPDDIRKTGRALNGDRRNGDVHVDPHTAGNHNDVRAFRGSLRV